MSARLRVFDLRQPVCREKRGRISGQRGFTMVELIAVMVVAGIMAAFAMPRFFERSTFDARNFADQSRAMLRHAQKIAIAQNRSVFVRLNGASVALCFDAVCSAGNLVIPPAGGNSGSSATVANCAGVARWECEGVPNGISYVKSPNYATFSFNALGRPYAPDDGLASSFARLVMTVRGDGVDYPIVVETETGYVH